MSDSPKPATTPGQWVRLTLGLLFLMGALYGLCKDGLVAWNFWKLSHPTAIAATPKGTNHLVLNDRPGLTNAVAINTPPAAKPVPKEAITRLASWFLADVVGLFIGIWLLQTNKKKSQNAAAGNEFAASMSSTAKAASRPAKRWQFCNVLQLSADNRRLWSFNAGKNGFTLGQQQVVPLADPLPPQAVGRDWKVLFQPKLNIAWLPVEQVFLRVIQLPVADFNETLAMVELQLEKISPLPATQIVWSVEILPQQTDNLQTVIVVMVARDVVEKFLGELEGIGFLADRLELPILDQLLATPIREDGAYLYPDETTGKFTALVAWWAGGVLRSLGLLHLPATEGRAAVLQQQLAQMAWAGELEGWLSGSPRMHLVADENTAANWQPLFQASMGQPAGVIAPIAVPQLATMNANRSARTGLTGGILPMEYATRYQQEFHDRLWMRGLGVILVVYIAAVMIYLGGAAVQSYRTDTVVGQMNGVSRAYTNTLQLKAQLEILQNRQTLKFASLDCWKVSAELLPEGVTIQNMEFKGGKEFSLSGVAPGDKGSLVTDFNEAMRKATLNDQPMFDELTIPSQKLNPGGSTLSWSFNGKLARAEELK